MRRSADSQMYYQILGKRWSAGGGAKASALMAAGYDPYTHEPVAGKPL